MPLSISVNLDVQRFLNLDRWLFIDFHDGLNIGTSNTSRKAIATGRTTVAASARHFMDCHAVRVPEAVVETLLPQRSRAIPRVCPA